MGYFRYGTATHSNAQGAMDLPESLAWLWRGYDPAQTSQLYEQDPEEKQKPFFRIKSLNRQ